MKYERYSGTFGSNNGVLWKVCIMQESESAFAVKELRFPFEEPLLIEWGETSKEDVIVSSTATLRVISPGDRTYADLYSIEVGRIRLDVYREGLLYWSGCLDPEFYEEPYTSNSDYEVEFTFSDFGILDRLKYRLSGKQNCKNLLLMILGESRINYNGINENAMSTQVPSAAGLGLAQLDVRSDNFYDEDGEACSLMEVAEGFLRPLGLRIEQRNGVVWVYDLNGAYNEFAIKKTEWQSDDQFMGVDKVINNTKVTLSIYSDATLTEGGIVYPGEFSEDTTDVSSRDTGVFSFYEDYSDKERIDNDWDYNDISFTLFTTNIQDANSKIAEKYWKSRWFHIEPMLGGSSADGVAYMFMTQGHGPISSGWPSLIGSNPQAKEQNVLIRTKRCYIPKISDKYTKDIYHPKYYIRLCQEVLIDPRYNPFTEAGEGNEANNYDDIKVWFGYVMIPATVTLYDEAGNALMHYTNEDVAKSSDKSISMLSTHGKWVKGASKYGDCWLEWYDPEDRKENTGVLGWKKNRHCIGLSKKELFKSFQKMAEGQYIPYPSEGGYLEVCIYTGIWPYDYGETDFGNTDNANKKGLYDKIRWMLYKAPTIEIVKSNIKKSGTDVEDVEYSSYINKSAKEDLNIDTICGTSEEQCPSSKAIFLNATTGEQVCNMYRAGRTTQVEQLLIGTLYSQYAERKTKLSGTIRLNSGDISLFYDAMQQKAIDYSGDISIDDTQHKGTISLNSGDISINVPKKRFICLCDIQDVKADISEVTLVELRPDEFEAN